MAGEQKQTKAKRKGVKKRFYSVETPLVSTPVELYLTAPEDAEGKTVALDLSRTLRGRSAVLTLRVLVEGEKLRAVPASFKLAGSHIIRTMRRGSDYVEDSFEVAGKEGNVLVKPFLLTRKKVSRSIRAALRAEARKLLGGWVKANGVDELFSDLIAGKVQKELNQGLRKIYPLAVAEVRWLEVLGGDGNEEKVEKKSE